MKLRDERDTLGSTSSENERAALSALLEALEGSLAREKDVTTKARSLPTYARLMLSALAIAALTAALGWLSPRPDLHGVPGARTLLSVGVYLTLLLALISVALRPLQRLDLPHWLERALGGAAIAVPWLFAAWPVEEAVAPAEQPRDCLVLGLSIGALIVIMLRALDRASGRMRGSTLVATAASGLSANLALIVHCHAQGLHVALVHAPLSLVLWAFMAAYVRWADRRTQRLGA